MANNEQVFWHRVDKTGSCWEWLGGKDRDGYGRYNLTKSQTLPTKWWGVHRLSYTLSKGPIPKGMVVCHTCDNPGCCNPDHLFVGTQLDNIKDMDAKGRRYRTKKI